MKVKAIFLNTIGIILTPILLAIFILDRVFLACFPWIKINSVQDWSTKHELMAYSIIRMAFVGLASGLVYLLI